MKCASGRIGTAVAAALLLTTVLTQPTGATTLQALTGIRSVASGAEGSCALLTSGGVDCWGFGQFGQLGNGTFYTSGNKGSAVPVAVKGVGGSGTLGGVASLSGDDNGFCALLTSGGVDCWGNGYSGELGNGTLYIHGHQGSAVPVAVKGVGGSGTLGGVVSLTSDGYTTCARLTSREADCWGAGQYGELGNGIFYTSQTVQGSALPVAVKGVGGSGTLGGVASLTSDGGSGLCALLISGKVDCWGADYSGQLGNGTFSEGSPNGSAVPVAVLGVGGSGTLSDVASLTSESYDGSVGYGSCALLTSGKVDCWGAGFSGQLGNGKFYTTGNQGSDIPVAVEGVAGSGTLGGVASLVSDDDGFCALLTSGGVNCWGSGSYGELGDGTLYTTGDQGSAVPVAVKGVSGSGTLASVTGLNGASYGSCARLASGKVDCWGAGDSGQLGNGTFYTNPKVKGSALPVAVKAVGGSGTLDGVASVNSYGPDNGTCARLLSGKADCWGAGYSGQLGDGTFDKARAVPVAVLT